MIGVRVAFVRMRFLTSDVIDILHFVYSNFRLEKYSEY